jgi:hypothetical protein
MTPGRVLVAFAFYAAALDLGFSRGLVFAVASPPGLVMLAAAALLLAVRAARAVVSGAPALRRAACALVCGGGALALAAIPASLAMRDARVVSVGEGQTLAPGPGVPALRFGNVTLAPRGPHVLSKTVSIEVLPEGGALASIGLFPPTAVGDYRMSAVRYGYAPGIVWLGPEGAPVVEGWVKLGTMPRREEDAELVSWTPEPNVMMGAGTFPPKLEDLVSPEGAGAHLFLRLDEAFVAGVRRDLRDPDAYRWLADGRLERPVFFVQAFRGKEKVFDGHVRGGEAVSFPGGALEIFPEVLIWVDVLAARDPWLPWAGVGLVALAAGLALRGALAVAAARRRAARAPA